MSNTARTADYRVIVRDFDTDFAPGDAVAEFENAKNVGYARYANQVGEAFFTVTQGDPKLVQIRTLIEEMPFVDILRNNELVFRGWIGETDETETDVVFYAYSLESAFFTLLTDFTREWTDSTIDTIVEFTVDAAIGATNSRLAWITKGTIEAPVTTSGGATAIELPVYTAALKRYLFLFQEMVSIATSDTTNRVMFELTPAGVFNFWKNKGTTRTSIKWDYGGGSVAGYRRLRAPMDTRNTIEAVGSNPRDVTLRKTVTDAVDQAARGRMEESVYFQWVRDETELTRVASFRAKRALREDSMLALSFMPGRVTPSRATGADYDLLDLVPVRIVHGVTNFIKSLMVTGEQIVVVRGKEHVRVFLQDL